MIYIINGLKIFKHEKYEIINKLKNGSTICIDCEGKTASFSKISPCFATYKEAEECLVSIINDKIIEVEKEYVKLKQLAFELSSSCDSLKE